MKNIFPTRSACCLLWILLSFFTARAEYSLQAISRLYDVYKVPERNFSVTVSYNGPQSDFRIYVRPMKNGQPCPNRLDGVSSVISGTTGYAVIGFTLLEAGKVDQLKLQIVSVGSNSVVYETKQECDILFEDYFIYDTVVNNGRLDPIETNALLPIRFSYIAKNGNVKIRAYPMSNGAVLNGYTVSSFGTYAAETGSDVGYISMNRACTIDKLKFVFSDPSSGQHLATQYMAVAPALRFISYNIKNVVLEDPILSTYISNSRIDVTFDYYALGGDVEIHIKAMNDGVILANAINFLDPTIHTNERGQITGYTGLRGGGFIDNLRFEFYDPQTHLLQAIRDKPVSILVIDFNIGILRAADTEYKYLSGVSVGPIPASDKLNVITNGATEFNYALLDASGNTVLAGTNGDNSIDIHALAPGVYKLVIKHEDEVIYRNIVKQ